jgi:hypothetical protein
MIFSENGLCHEMILFKALKIRSLLSSGKLMIGGMFVHPIRGGHWKKIYL